MTTPDRKVFLSRKPPIEFDIDDDTFVAVGAVPADEMKGLMKHVETMQNTTDFNQRYDGIVAIVSQVLTEKSLVHFNERLKDKDNPVSMDALGEISAWLVGEVYSKRPTQSPSLSTPGEKSGGESSTGGAPVPASIPSTSSGPAT